MFAHKTSHTVELSSLWRLLVLGYLNWQGLKSRTNDKLLRCNTGPNGQVRVASTVPSDVYAGPGLYFARTKIKRINMN